MEAFKKKGDALITIDEDAVWIELGPLVDTAGTMIVRQEYKDMYDRMVKGARERRRAFPGTILTGQPGIGTSINPMHVTSEISYFDR